MLALTVTVPAFAGNKVWDKKFVDDIRYKKVTDAGVLLLMTDAGIIGVDAATGNELWSKPEYKKLKEEDVEYVAGSPLLIVSKTEGFVKKKGKLTAINTMDGSQAWEVEGLAGAIYGSSLALEQGLVLLFEQNLKHGGIDILAFDMVTGQLKYTVEPPPKMEMKKVKYFRPAKPGRFSSRLVLTGNQEPVFNGNFMYLYYDMLRKIDLTTGKTVWAVDMKKGGIPAVVEHYAQMVLKNGVIYTPYGKGMAAFDANSGQMKWVTKKPVNSGHVTDMVFEGDLVYYKGGGWVEGAGKKVKNIAPALGVLALADGSPQWKKEYKIKGGCTNVIIEGDKLYVADSDNLRILNKKDGSEVNKKFKIGFKNDDPNRLVRQDNGLIVKGSQNVALVDIASGKETVTWQQSFRAPGAGGFAKFAMFAISAMAYMQASSDAMNSYSGTFENDSANRRRSQAWDGFSKVMAIRYKATQSTDKYQYILTDLDGGSGLKGVNLKTGKADREALLKDKQPDYELDEIMGFVFNQRGDKEIEAFKF